MVEASVSDHTSLIQKIPPVSEAARLNQTLWSSLTYMGAEEAVDQLPRFHVVWLFTILTVSFAAVQSLNSLNDQIAQFMVTRPCSLADEDEAFMPGERDTLRKSMTLMRHLLMDAQVQQPCFQQGQRLFSRCLSRGLKLSFWKGDYKLCSAQRRDNKAAGIFN